MTTNNKWEEEMSDIIHEVWNKWQKYLHSKCLDRTIPDILWNRWEKQIKTQYSKLSENEKESDRKVFREFYLPLISKIETDAYNRGKEETLEKVKEVIGKLKLNYDRDYYPSILNEVEGIREQILQELNNI